MKTWAFLAILAGLALVWYFSKTQEKFTPQFEDKSNVKRTAETSSSSYAQETNHMPPSTYPQDPIPGVETPFRVNMFNSFMV
jgi:hypothetical protein